MALEFTTIQHGFRKKHGLSLNEYVLCDMIHLLSTNPSSDVPGWCFMNKENQAKELDLSRRTIMTLTKKMVQAGFLKKHPTTKHLKSTKKWFDVYCTYGAETALRVQKIPKQSAETAPEHGAETAPNTIYNNTNINNSLLSEIKISEVPQDLKDYFEIASSFQKLFIETLKSKKSPSRILEKAKFKKWVDPVRLMMQTENVTKENLQDAYKFLKDTKPDSEFWKKNILSTTALRKNISKLLLQAAKASPSSDLKPRDDDKVNKKLKNYDS